MGIKLTTVWPGAKTEVPVLMGNVYALNNFMEISANIIKMSPVVWLGLYYLFFFWLLQEELCITTFSWEKKYEIINY
jgi:hypothetical protein